MAIEITWPAVNAMRWDVELKQNVQNIVDAVDALPTTEAVTEQIDESVEVAIQRAQRYDGVFVPSPTAGLRLRQIRTQILAGDRQGHIAVLGDSIPYGAAATGASNPKPENNWPGRVRSILNARYGYAGGGFTLADNNLFSNMSWDPRWTKVGNVVTHTFGPFGTSCWRADGGAGGTYIEFTDDCTEFVIYTLTAGGSFTARVDGGATITLANVASGFPSDITKEPGYMQTAGSAINVYRIPAGAQGTHTLRLTPSSNASQDLFLVAIEPVVVKTGTFRVGNMSVSGKSLQSFLAGGGETTTTTGIVYLDTLRADILVMELGINDWQGQRSVASIKADIATVVSRQRSAGNSSGSVHPNGDVILVWNPKPDVDSLGGGSYTNPTWDEVRAAYYEAAIENDVCLIDMGDRWGGSFSAANDLGLYADSIHPNDSGADDIAPGVIHAIFDVI